MKNNIWSEKLFVISNSDVAQLTQFSNCMHGGWLLGWLQPYACFLVTFGEYSGYAARARQLTDGGEYG